MFNKKTKSLKNNQSSTPSFLITKCLHRYCIDTTARKQRIRLILSLLIVGRSGKIYFL